MANSTNKTEAQRPLPLNRLLTIYTVLMSGFITMALVHDSNAFDSYMSQKYGYLTDNSYSSLTIFLMVLGVYLIRLAFLLLPQLLKKFKSVKGWIVGGLLAASIPEAILIIMATGLVFEQTAGCDNGGEFSNCGWSAVIIPIVIAISCGAQIVGMILGGIISHERKVRKW